MKPLDSQEFKTKWKGVKLSEKSRARMENTLTEYAQFHGVKEGESGTVRGGGESRSIERIPQSGILSFIQLSNWNLKPMTALILIALLAGGTTSFAAERAVPGDTLYGVKVEVNEEFKSIFALSNEAEARLQATLVQERLEEAEVLATRGELSEAVAADLAVRTHTHAKAAQARSDQAEAEGDHETAASVRAALEGTLMSYVHILSSLNVNGSNSGTANLLGDLGTMIKTTHEAQATATINTSTEADVRAEVQPIMDAASDLINKARVELAEADLSAAIKANTEARLAEGVQAYANAEASFRSNAYKAAYTSATTAMRIAEEVRILINSALRVDLNVETGVQGSSADTQSNTTNDDNVVEGDTNVIIDTSVDTNGINLQSDTSVNSVGKIGL